MNNIIELTDKAELSSSERTANKYRLDEIILTMKLKKEKI